jgi:hypothetical protein
LVALMVVPRITTVVMECMGIGWIGAGGLLGRHRDSSSYCC